MIPAPAGLVALRCLDLEDAEEILLSTRVVCLDEDSGAPTAWVVGPGGVICRADQLEGFVGFDWAEPVVGAVAGRGWKARVDGQELDVEAWLVRADGRLAAAVIDGDGTSVVDPLEDDCGFVRAPDDDPAE